MVKLVYQPIKNGGQGLPGLTHWAHMASHWRRLRCHSCLGTIDVDWHQHQARKSTPNKRWSKNGICRHWWTKIWFLCKHTPYFFWFDFVRIVKNNILTQIRFGCQTVCIFLLNWGVIGGRGISQECCSLGLGNTHIHFLGEKSRWHKSFKLLPPQSLTSPLPKKRTFFRKRVILFLL